MKANKTEQRALLELISKIYQEIRDVEQEWSIYFDEHDFRPRIEYFHDAVRAFSANDNKGIEAKTGRLSVEMLAYDIGMLRFIQAHPVPKTKGKLGKLSPQMDVTPPLPRVANDRTGARVDAKTRLQLAELYKNYSVIFAAMLTEAADRNYKTRMTDHDTEVEDLADFMQTIQSEGHGFASIDIEALVGEEVHNPDLLNRLMAALKAGKMKKKMQTADALRALKETASAMDKEAKIVEQAHFTYATGQLAIYEASRDAIKKMAGKGFNIVGDFVQSAMNEASRSQRNR